MNWILKKPVAEATGKTNISVELTVAGPASPYLSQLTGHPAANQVRITCYEIQRPGAAVSGDEESSFGKSLIPEKYTRYATSGITIDVKAGANEPLEIVLTDE